MTGRVPLVFLVDVDNTLLDNDRLLADLRQHLEHELGAECRDRYWAIVLQLFEELGYRDYLGALQRYRDEHPLDLGLMSISAYMLDYPFADRLFPAALEVLRRLERWAPTVLLTDGDAVFQPRKLHRSGLAEAVKGRWLIYIHKESPAALDDVARRFPADRYVLVDDKLRILDTVKKSWGARVTTVLPRQGMYACDPKIDAAYPPADLTVESIGDLLRFELDDLLAAPPAAPSFSEVTR